MKLQPPIENYNPAASFSQLFGVNRAVYKPRYGIPGHNGLDFVIKNPEKGYGEPILAAHSGTVVSITQDVPWNTKGNGLYILSDDGTFSTNYWHVSQFLVGVGDRVGVGHKIALLGNSGHVSPRPSQGCPRCGSHLHFGLKIHGLSNDYKGFIDPLQYLHIEGDKYNVRFNRNLYLGLFSNEVAWLQTFLKIELGTIDYDPLNYFGYKTLRDVIALQKKWGLTPAYGYVGPKTRNFLNKKFTIYG